MRALHTFILYIHTYILYLLYLSPIFGQGKNNQYIAISNMF